MKEIGIACFCGVFLLLGCRKDIQNTESVRQGILEYLAKRPDLSAMDVSVGSVSFRKDEADAVVSFRAKDGPPNNGMEMKYILERKGNRWEVKGRAGSGIAGAAHPGISGQASPHGGTGGMNPGSMNPGLPPGHPPLPAQQTRPPLQ